MYQYGKATDRTNNIVKEEKVKTIGKCRYCDDPIYDFQEAVHLVCGSLKAEAETRAIIVKELEAIWHEANDLEKQLGDYIAKLKTKMEVEVAKDMPYIVGGTPQPFIDPNKCPTCGGDRNSPAGTGCPIGSHYGTNSGV